MMIAFSLASCQWGASTEDQPAITTDTLQYIYKDFKQKEAGCENKPDSACVYIDIYYPVFKNQSVLNDTLTKYILSNFSSTDSVRTLHQLATDYLVEQKTDPKHPNYIRYDLELSANIRRQDSSLTTIEVAGDYFYAHTEGERTVTETYFINWDTKKSKLLKLSDILINNYSDQLTKIAEAIFRKDENLGANASLEDYKFEGGKFAINNNFLITPIGLKFLYNRGEAKPNGYGQVVVFIPYSQILTLLRPNTVIEQYHK